MAYEVTTEAESRKAVQELAARKVDIVKIWVDDRNGRAPKLSAPLYRAIIDEGHKHGLKVNAHVFYHVDAVDLVDAGIDGFAHLVRDTVMDDALVAAIVKTRRLRDGQSVEPAQVHLCVAAAVAVARRSDDAVADRIGERAGARSPARLLRQARSESRSRARGSATRSSSRAWRS